MTLTRKLSGAIALLAITCVLTVGMLASQMHSSSSEYQGLLTGPVDQSARAREMQVAFKTQVQEWKNLLLRGTDPKQFETYSKALQDEGQIVQTTAAELRDSVSDAALKARVEEFRASHEALTKSYVSAMGPLQESGGENVKDADAAVKGQDRAPNSQVDGLVKDLQDSVSSAAAKQEERVDSTNKWLLIGGIPLGLLMLALITVCIRSIARLTSAIASNAQVLANSSDVLTEVSRTMAGTASDTQSQAGDAADASEEVTSSVQSVATAVEEMTASIGDISESAAGASQVAADASHRAAAANEAVLQLGEASARISKVVEVITSIAQQTNLLALNATIEAARAGEAGKGFAVVANEVKDLAKETAAATEEIGSLIAAIQGETGSVVNTITEISSVIDRVNELQVSIAGAVEEQRAVAAEIAANVNHAASGVDVIGGNVQSVANLAANTSSLASRTLDAAEEIAVVVEQMRSTVGGSSSHPSAVRNYERPEISAENRFGVRPVEDVDTKTTVSPNR